MSKRQKYLSSVVASSKAEIQSKLVVASYHCNSCEGEFAANKALQPFCVKCGSEDVAPLGVDTPVEDIKKLDDSELSSIPCPSCNTHNIVSDSTAIASSGKIHCIACGDRIDYELSEGMDVEEGEGEEPEADMLPVVDDSSETDDESEDDKSEANCNDEHTKSEESESDDDEEGEGGPVSDDDSDDTKSEEEEVPADQVTMRMLDLASLTSDADTPVRFARSGKQVFAFVGDLCVARLSSKQAQDAESFASANYLRALSSSVDENGLEATLEDQNFNMVEVDIDESLVTDNSIDAQVAGRLEEMESAAAKFNDVFKQSLGIAAAGLNKGWFKEHTNQLKFNLFETLSTAGVRNAASIIDTAFEASSDAYSKQLIDLAFTLVDKPEDVRNSMADTIGASNYIMASEDEDGEDIVEDEEAEGDEVLSRLESGMHVAESASVADVRRPATGKLFHIHK